MSFYLLLRKTASGNEHIEIILTAFSHGGGVAGTQQTSSIHIWTNEATIFCTFN